MQQMKAFIVMPENAPVVKRNAVEGYGATIIPSKATLTSREETMEKVLADTGAFFIHPYNNYEIIAGQATACYELLSDHGDIDTVIAPVGGGGLLSGTCLSAHYLRREVRVFGAEPSGAADAFKSLEKGEIVPSVNPVTIADGLLTSLGDKTFPIIRKYVSGIRLVDDKDIVTAMRILWERMKLVVEPSGAVPLAAVLGDIRFFKGRKIGVILSGGNVDLTRLPFG
jgi:threonine dehydratase